MAAELTILGAAQTVTGSKHLLSYKGFNLLVDCGLYQGAERVKKDETLGIGIEASKVDAVVLTHAHLDHCGYLPRLVRDGFKGPIFATETTKDIARIILLDAAKIQLEEIREAKKLNLSKHQIGEPLYFDHEVKNALNHFRPLGYRDPVTIGPFEIILHQAGHIPGAASAGVRWKEGSLLFSGDLGRYNDLMTFDPEVNGSYDKLVIESTYGGRSRGSDSQFDVLKSVLEKAKKKGGTLLIPSFSLSRSQLLMLHLIDIFNSYPELKLPVYVNSPMANEVTETMIMHNDSVRQNISDFNDALSGIHFIKEHWEANNLYENDKPKIIITASGMVSGGRVLNHMVNLGGDSQNIIFLPGFQAPETNGADLVAGKKNFFINDQEVILKAEVIHSDSFSAHADQSELIKWIGSLEVFPKEIFLVHGRHQGMEDLKNKIEEVWEHAKVHIPEIKSSFEL